MAAEDYDDVPGIGGGNSGTYQSKPKSSHCKFCNKLIRFSRGKPINLDGLPHRCLTTAKTTSAPTESTFAFATAAMAAIVAGLVNKYGFDYLGSIDAEAVSSQSWRIARAMEQDLEF